MWNESFFSAPQLKRDSLGAPPVPRRNCVSLMIVALFALARTAHAQRLSVEFANASRAPLVIQTGYFSMPASRYQPRDCHGHTALRIAAGALGGGAGGWLAYELAVGIWVSAEGAHPDANMRRLRTTLILAGAGLGVARAAYISWRCRSE